MPVLDACRLYDMSDPYIVFYRARAYLSPLASNTLLVPSRLAFLQRSASGTDLPAA